MGFRQSGVEIVKRRGKEGTCWSGSQGARPRAEQESRWTKNKAGFDSVTEDQRIMTETEGNLMALTRFSTNRFLWAPVMKTTASRA